MQNNNNKKVVLVLALAMFMLFISPMSASARVVSGGGQYLLVTDEYIPPANPNVLGASTKKAAPTVVTKAPTKKKVASASVTTKGATTVNEGSVAGASDANSNLSANALSSAASFMPDTLLEWVFLFILILLGVKLWRSATVTEKEKHAPLKHA